MTPPQDNLKKEIEIKMDFNDPLTIHSQIWYDYIKDNAEWIKTDYFDGQQFAIDFENLGDKIKLAKSETLKKVFKEELKFLNQQIGEFGCNGYCKLENWVARKKELTQKLKELQTKK